MPSNKPSTFFSTTILTVIYLIVGDFAFCLTRLALSYELFKQLLYIYASAVVVQNVAHSLAGDDTAVITAKERNIQTEQRTLAENSDVEPEVAIAETGDLDSDKEQSIGSPSEDAISEEDDDEESDATVEEEEEDETAEEEPEDEEDEEALQQQAEQDALTALRAAIPASISNLNPFSGKPCVGTTKKGAKCGQTFFSPGCLRHANTQLTTMLSVNPGANFERIQLAVLAENLLCPRWHKKPGYSQVSEVANMWYNELYAARAALANLEDAREWGRELRKRREAEQQRRPLLLTPTAPRYSSSNEVGTPESDLSRTLSRSPSRSPAVSVSAASSTASSRKSSLSIASDETPSLHGDEEATGRKAKRAINAVSNN